MRPPYRRPVTAVCPYLALAADGRTVLEIPDRQHRCHALEPPAELTRRDQATLCLLDAHRGCPRYLTRDAALLEGGEPPQTSGRYIELPSTRLVVTPAPVSLMTAARAARRPLAFALTLVVGVAMAGALGTLANELREPSNRGQDQLVGRGDGTTTAAPVPTEALTPAPAVSPTPAAAETPAPEPVVETPPPDPVTPPPVPEVATYVVVEGDTLWGIATRFGTTPDAIMAYNGLETDVLQIDQVLLIP